MCSSAINNTRVVLEFCQLSNRPSLKLVKKFVTELGVKAEFLLALRYNNYRNAAVLEFADSSVAATFVNKTLIYKENKIPVYLEDNAKEVYIHDLPLGMDNTDIAQAMCKYGDVLSIANERWKNFFPGLPNGVRILRMIVNQPVPRSITVRDHIATVIYKGQKPLCKLNAKKAGKKVKNNNDANKEGTNNENISETNDKGKKNKHISINNNANTNSNHGQPIVETSSSSSNNNNNNSDVKINSNHEQSTSMDLEDEINDEEFQLVRSKRDRKSLKRVHSTEPEGKLQNIHPDPEALAGLSKPKRVEAAEELLSEVTRKEDFYFQKWIEAKSDGSEDLLEAEEFKEKFLKYHSMRNKILDKKMEDIFNS